MNTLSNGRARSTPRVSDVPEDLLAAQHHFTLERARTDWLPSHRLMLAVLMDAIMQLKRGGRAAEESRAWIRREDESDFAFSFTGVCEALAIDRDALSRRLLDAGAAPPRIRRSVYTTRRLRQSRVRNRRTALRPLKLAANAGR